MTNKCPTFNDQVFQAKDFGHFEIKELVIDSSFENSTSSLKDMTSKERVLKAIYGDIPDRVPITIPYLSIYIAHCRENLPGINRFEYLYGNAEQRLSCLERIIDLFQFDWLEVGCGPSREWERRHKLEIVGEKAFLDDLLTGEREQIYADEPCLTPSAPCLYSKKDIDEQIKIRKVEDLIKTGIFDLPREAVRRFGDKQFIYSIISCPFISAHSYLGLKTLMEWLYDKPNLLHYLMQKIFLQLREYLKAFAQIGLHGLWIEECCASSDMISPRHYEEFAFPFEKKVIEETKRLGLASIFYFCGEVYPVLNKIRELEPDALALEESKKGFEIDIAEVKKVVGDEMCLFGNIDAMNLLPKGSPKEIEAEVKRQIRVAGYDGRFAMALGSPITPETPLEKVKLLVELTKKWGKYNCIVEGEKCKVKRKSWVGRPSLPSSVS